MRAFLNLLKQIITAGSGVSSKRVCGLLGWLVLLVCLGYATWNSTELPLVTPDFIFGTIILLGVDSVTAIWKKFPNKGDSDPGPASVPRDSKPPHGPSPRHLVDGVPPSDYIPEETASSGDPCPYPSEDPEPGSLNNAQL